MLEGTLARVGNEEYAKENRSFGLTALRNRHARIAGSKLTLDFRGKSGIPHHIDRRLANILRRCKDIPGQDLFQYLDEDGEPRGIASDDVKDYLREIAGEEVTAKDFRTWAATNLAALALTALEQFDSQTKAKKNIVQAVETVSKRLGNTPAICRKCYIHPAIFDGYLDGSLAEGLKARADATLAETEAARGAGLSAEEVAVTAFLSRRLGEEIARQSSAARPVSRLRQCAGDDVILFATGGDGMDKIAVVGAGLIGRAWAIVFARAGFGVALWDAAPEALSGARGFIAHRLPELRDAGLLRDGPDDVLSRINLAETLESALAGAVHVQENGPERLEDKRAVFAALDEKAEPSAILASSTSGIPASTFTENLRGRARCLVAHPVNPPYLVPIVELCPAPWTDPQTIQAARELMLRAGQVPATVKREVAGFVLNRLQIALVSEAFRLVADGVVSPEDLDATVKHGLGLRWSFMGPFETIDLNAPGGLADYCDRYGGLYDQVQSEITPYALTPELVDDIDRSRRAALPLRDQPARQEWRDRRLMALLAHKASQPDR